MANLVLWIVLFIITYSIIKIFPKPFNKWFEEDKNIWREIEDSQKKLELAKKQLVEAKKKNREKLRKIRKILDEK